MCVPGKTLPVFPVVFGNWCMALKCLPSVLPRIVFYSRAETLRDRIVLRA